MSPLPNMACLKPAESFTPLTEQRFPVGFTNTKILKWFQPYTIETITIMTNLLDLSKLWMQLKNEKTTNQTCRVQVNSPEKQPMKKYIRKVSTPRITVFYIGHFWKGLTFLYYRVLVQLAVKKTEPMCQGNAIGGQLPGILRSSSKLWIAWFIYPLMSW